MDKKIIIGLLILVVIFLIGCQTPYQQLQEQGKLEEFTVEEPVETDVEELPVEEKEIADIETTENLEKEQKSEDSSNETQLPEEYELFDVHIGSNEFNPETQYIVRGDEVTWDNKDTKQHKIVCYLEGSRIITSPTLQPGNTFAYRFPLEGGYTCIDAIYGLKGYIKVKSTW